jgi:hypothetical protein
VRLPTPMPPCDNLPPSSTTLRHAHEHHQRRQRTLRWRDASTCQMIGPHWREGESKSNRSTSMSRNPKYAEQTLFVKDEGRASLKALRTWSIAPGRATRRSFKRRKSDEPPRRRPHPRPSLPSRPSYVNERPFPKRAVQQMPRGPYASVVEREQTRREHTRDPHVYPATRALRIAVRYCGGRSTRRRRY